MNKRRILLLLVPGLLLLASAESVHAQDEPSAKRELLLDDFGSFHIPESPAISTDGARVAFVLDDRIYLASTDEGEPRPLTSASSKAMRPRWSAAGDSLYFLSDRGDSTQMWVLPVDKFGEATKITDFDHDISSFRLSPDESCLLLELSDQDIEKESNDQEPQPIVVTRRHFKVDAGDGYITAGESSHLYVYDIEQESLTQLTSGEFEEKEAAWSPDGRAVVFVSNRDDPDATYSNDLWIVAADKPDKGETLRRLTNNPDTKQSPAWSPAGNLIAYITAVDGVYGQQHVAVVPSQGGEPRILTSGLDRWVRSFEFSDDGAWIYFNYDESGATKLARVRLRDSAIETLVECDCVVSAFDVGKGRDLAVLANGRVDTTDVYHLRGARLRRLTGLNQDLFQELALGDKFQVSFESPDGTVVEAFITTPPQYEPGRAYPAILNIHGGPVDQFAWGFNFTAQYFAANGYVVIEPNPRGSTGRGQDYINAIYRSWGFEDYEDVIAAVDFAVEQGIADPDRLAVTGYSYGGYMTDVVITRSNRFKAAASGAGESHLDANFGHDIYQKWFLWEFGAPWEHRERYDLVSPYRHVAKVETPTLFLGGRNDWNVPILNSELMYQALQVRGIDSQLVVYPGTYHSGWSDEFEKDYKRRIVDWFDKYLASE